MDTKISILQCVINPNYKLMIPSQDVRANYGTYSMDSSKPGAKLIEAEAIKALSMAIHKTRRNLRTDHF